MDNKDVAEVLNGLIKLDYDAIEAYAAAVKRLEDPTLRNRLGEFMQDHRQHTQNLSDEVRRLGAMPATGPGAMRLLTEGAVVLGGLANDKGILHAMSNNEAITNKSYQSALEKLMNHASADVVRQNREDERRHKQWIDAALESEDYRSVDVAARQQTQVGRRSQRDLR